MDMKKIKNFLIDIVISIFISLPFALLCDWIAPKSIIDWLDIQLALSCFAVLMLITNILVARWNKKATITRVVNAAAIVALASTVVYGVFMILEWLFPGDAADHFTGNWEQWMPVSISLSTFLYIQERRRAQSYINENDLVVAVGYQNKDEAETICTLLKEKGIKTMLVEKGSVMYINGNVDTPLQIQVMRKDLESAKKIIK